MRPSPTPPTPRLSAWIVFVMLAMIAFPAAIALHTVHIPGTLQISARNPSPHGYTWSLLLFVVPILTIGLWFIPSEGLDIPQRAFWRTLAILVPVGCALDFFFAHYFFIFPNRGATLGIGAPALGGCVPAEEYFFYFTGFVAILLIYIWLDEFWLVAYNVADYPGESRKIPRLLQFHPTSAVLGVVLIAAAFAYKKWCSPSPAGFPAYFIVLVLGGLVPSVSFFPTVRPFINWRAFSLTLFLILLVSLLWEATLAVPYDWWGYQSRQMMGLFIGAWFGLPIEAVFVWMAVTYGTTIVFEIMKLWKASGRVAKEAFWGAALRARDDRP